jgi:PAS domain S-box-containing protein
VKLLEKVAHVIGFALDHFESEWLRKLAEEALLESEERYRQIAENIREVFWIADVDLTRVIYVSPAYEKIWGRTCKSLYAEPGSWAESIHPDDRQRVSEAIQPRTPQGHTVEYRVIHSDGSIRWVLDRGFPVRNATGEIYRVAGISEDITERKRAEEKLRDSEARLALAVKATEVGMFDWNVVTGESEWTEQYCSIMGYPPTEMRCYQDWADRVHPDDFSMVEERVRRAMAEKTPYGAQYRISLPDGTLRFVEAKGLFTYDAVGNVSKMLGTVRDITQGKQAEQELRESEERYRNLIMHSPDAIFVNYQDRVILVNNACQRLFGARSAQELIGKSPYELFHQAFHRQLRERIHCLRNLSEPVSLVEEQIVRLDGEIVDVEVLTAPFPLYDTNAIHVILRDITERKRTEDEQEKLQAQLNQAQKMESVGRLAGGVAHDFNNMLGVILGHSEMAMNEVDSSQPLYADLQEIQKAANRSADLTRQLLAFARKQTASPKVLNLNETVESMLKMLKRLIGENIELAWLPDENLWPVKIDPSQIDQILANLSVNACDAIDGVGKLTIRTENAIFDETCRQTDTWFVPGEYVVLTLSDDGIGMDEETRNRIFEPFFTTKEVGKGTGLGLATVYGIVKQNNGFIGVHSESGQGTTFKIYLPRHAGQTGEELMPNALKIPKGGGETVLLVEDEPTILNMTAKMLQRMGYNVLTASTPGEAMRLAEAHPGEIHLLMTDVVMPEMNGRDLAKNLLSIFSNIKRLFMSGYTADIIAHHGVLDPGVNFIQKPFSMQNLAAKLREALGGDDE